MSCYSNSSRAVATFCLMYKVILRTFCATAGHCFMDMKFDFKVFHFSNAIKNLGLACDNRFTVEQALVDRVNM